MPPPPPRPISRPIETYGVALALDRIRDDVAQELTELLPAALQAAWEAWAAAERAAGRLELSEDQVTALAHRTGQLGTAVAVPLAAAASRRKAGTAVGETWVLAINKAARDADHARDTPVAMAICPTCQQPVVSR